MTTHDMITELTQTVNILQKDIKLLKEDKNYLYDKLENAYSDRTALRSENYKLKNTEKQAETTSKTPIFEDEEDCIACSA
jgi:FtsZ-binding cell division protein ZapB